MMVGVNWIGHFYLFQLLQDIVESSAPCRVIILSSAAQLFARQFKSSLDVLLDSETNKNEFSSFPQYGNSKLLNILHCVEIDRRFKEKGINNINVLAVHPGLIKTELGRYRKKAAAQQTAWSYIVKVIDEFEIRMKAEDGAWTQLFAGFSPKISENGISGKYIVPFDKVINSPDDYYFMLSNRAYDPVLARKYWEEAESITQDWPKF